MTIDLCMRAGALLTQCCIFVTTPLDQIGTRRFALITSLVAAVAKNGVIGAGGGLPWRLSSDLKRFRSVTLGKPVVMGRRTWDSIGRPLAGRTNIVVSRSASAEPGGEMFWVNTLDSAMALARQIAERTGAEEICVIGGGDIFAETIDQADRLYVTHVMAEPTGETYFPAIDPVVWRPVRREVMPRGANDSADMEFVVYERRADEGKGVIGAQT
jgi:dihydrofolate reductase